MWKGMPSGLPCMQKRKSPVGGLSKRKVLQQISYTREVSKAGLTFLMFPVYEIKRCNETSEKTVLEAGNNTMDIDCTDAFKGTIEGTVFKMDSPDL